jgi:hypothetical protein
MIRMIRTLTFASALCALGTAAVAGGEKHALLGTWSVDVAKIQQPNPPKSVTLTLEEAGEGMYHITVTIEAPDGSKQKSEGTFRPDGSANRVADSQDVDVASMTMPTRRMLVMGGGFGGHPTTTRVWVLSDDGTHMIETAIRHLPDGTPYQRVITWTRQ